ncbi:hypothetical protein AVEN_244095-1 [Araneus ventricosus]|uniref:DDE-1 domain-containing protein n=1 Tax=Araneus ventricosus TaxID=182803 RepID=A0A4Y2NEV5_ARAVE|nr:hypothetical protein AVEN_244095-1 [Araneus ventricosus]
MCAKKIYRKIILRKLVESDDSSDSVWQLIKNITIKDVIFWVSESWDNYTQNCYEDTTEHTVTEWLSCDTEANQLYTDEEIISLVQNKPQDDSDREETDEPENVLVFHSEAANALEIALRYIEQSENATSTDIMFMRC